MFIVSQPMQTIVEEHVDRDLQLCVFIELFAHTVG